MAFQLLICDVALAGDIRQTIHRGIDDPVTYPERLVLEFIHGADTVTEIRSIGEVERTHKEEYSRLLNKYGVDTIQQLFPGHNATVRLPEQDSTITTFDRSPRGIQGKSPEGKAAAKKEAKRRASKNANDGADSDLPLAGSTDEDDDDLDIQSVSTGTPAVVDPLPPLNPAIDDRV